MFTPGSLGSGPRLFDLSLFSICLYWDTGERRDRVTGYFRKSLVYWTEPMEALFRSEGTSLDSEGWVNITGFVMERFALTKFEMASDSSGGIHF